MEKHRLIEIDLGVICSFFLVWSEILLISFLECNFIKFSKQLKKKISRALVLSVYIHK